LSDRTDRVSCFKFILNILYFQDNIDDAFEALIVCNSVELSINIFMLIYYKLYAFPVGKIGKKQSAFLINSHSKYSAILSKMHVSVGDFAH